TTGRVLLGTDAPVPLIVPGFAIFEELANLVRAGLTPYEAIHAGTVNAARCLGREAEFGTVCVGARADLVLLDADPLVDIDNVRKIAGVMVRGKWLSREFIDQTLQRIAEAHASPETRQFQAPALPPCSANAVRSWSAIYRIQDD